MKNKIFPFIITLSALAVSGSAAFYSIFGLGKMFAGASLQVMILAASLEFAKLVTASLLYQYWKDINKTLKAYLLVATFVLIIITSAGIYGFLSSAYQDTAFKVENQSKNIEMIDNQISSIKRDIISYENQVEQKNKRVAQLTELRLNLQSSQDTIIRRGWSTKNIRAQITEIESEIKRLDSFSTVLNDSIASKNTRIYAMESQKLELQSTSDIAHEVGPLKYISQLTGKPMDVVVNWYIFVLIFVFDPLAIALVVSANFAFRRASRKKPEKSEENEEKKEPQILPDLPPVSEVKPETQTSVEEEKIHLPEGFKIKQFNEDTADQKINMTGLIPKTDLIKTKKIQEEKNTLKKEIIEEIPQKIPKKETNKYIDKDSFMGYKINNQRKEEDPLTLR